MTAPANAKPQGAKPGVSGNTLLGQQIDYKHKRTRLQLSKPPQPLESLQSELLALETLIRAPRRQYHYMKCRTLNSMRWMGAERCARAAWRDGKSKQETAALLRDVLENGACPPFFEVDDCIDWCVYTFGEGRRA